jgi:DNA-binding NtrC family response regulator
MAWGPILHVEDERWFHQQVSTWMPEAEWSWAGSLNEARDLLNRQSFEIILLDRHVGSEDGLEFLPEIAALAPGAVCLVVSSDEDGDGIREALEAGAKDYLIKSPDMAQDLRLRIQIARKSLQDERLLRSRSVADSGSSHWIGNSAPSRALKEKARKVAPSDAPVLITGESGTGKEVFAQELHRLRADPKRPFVAVNCGAIPETMFESELFGHRKGAFTGALAHKEGLVRIADGGDLFLDEIGDLPLAQQVKLLRFLQDGTFTPVGSGRMESARVRIIAATHRNLEQEVSEGRFREDLLFRLDVVRVQTVPLRERREDIAALARFFVTRFGGPRKKISKEALALLEKQDWKGNVRELSSVIQRGLIEADDEDLRPGHFRFPAGIASIPKQAKLPLVPGEITGKRYRQFMEHHERSFFESALKLLDGDTLRLSENLELSRATVYNRFQKLGLKPGKKRV